MPNAITSSDALTHITRHADLADVYLTHAQLLVDEYCRDHDGDYTQDVINDAVIAQIEFWDVNDINPQTVSVTASTTIASASLNGGSYTMAGSEETFQSRVKSATELCWRAQAILRAATGSASRKRITVVG